ncbi:MAG: glycosyltransferase family 2 protein [Porphyromonas somerae]|uniref:glycosyltransferase family 2 protein n=1 Tax=Porphyromonas somerae TaxID=322095 RepID=UPI0026E9AEEA|nr:glycosyltransferase family 2 protein [Porphyromonas somerae]MDD7558162.1 glycosyltransferase family 2 protein [Porphyromonas somerae]MDY3883958.1 glycosyltransferase family 2 protein [Porphyromonas somerae]MDY5815720.1 glycosyltransferase family 2 protein [Porphyromonas somerae]
MNSAATNAPLLSIIIPIYNTDKYLDECFESIVAQTYQNWEAILINDGSTDNSEEICLMWVKKDPRFQYHKFAQNSGPSAVRRRGMDLAQGDIIGGVDSDDFILPNHFSSLIDAMQKYDADIAMSGFRKTYNDGRFRKRSLRKSAGHVWEHPQLLIETCIDKIITGSLPNKIFRKGILQKEDFPAERRLYEDFAAIIKPISRAKRAVHTGLYTYCYRWVESSITHTSTFQHFYDSFVLSYARYLDLDPFVESGVITDEVRNMLQIFPKKSLLKSFHYANKMASTPEEKAHIEEMRQDLTKLGLKPIKCFFHTKMFQFSIEKRINEYRLRHL